MLCRRRTLMPLADRGPLRVMFITTSMPVGGAETLLVNLVRRLDRDRFAPSLCCLKAPGPLGETLADEIPTFHGLIHGKYDLGVAFRLAHFLRRQRCDAVVTVGAGDKMFWGRIAARLAGVPVVCCALHSTGWPDAVTRANRLRLLTRWTDAFIAVAAAHGRHLVEVEGFPANKVRVIPNGIDVGAFQCDGHGEAARRNLGIDARAPLVGIVAALRPKKITSCSSAPRRAFGGRFPRPNFSLLAMVPSAIAWRSWLVSCSYPPRSISWAIAPTCRSCWPPWTRSC